jgi:hypothetical protein
LEEPRGALVRWTDHDGLRPNSDTKRSIFATRDRFEYFDPDRLAQPLGHYDTRF